MEQLGVPGLTRLDGLDLARTHPGAPITFEDRASGDSRHGELVTLAVIGLTLTGLRAVSAWMLKNRSHGRIERTIEITRDGETRVERISIEVSESTTEADVVRALAELTKFELPAET